MTESELYICFRISKYISGGAESYTFTEPWMEPCFRLSVRLLRRNVEKLRPARSIQVRLEGKRLSLSVWEVCVRERDKEVQEKEVVLTLL